MDELVKQRLAGSIVLALIALILIPWLLSDPQDPRQSIRASFDGTPVPEPGPEARQDELVLIGQAQTPDPRSAHSSAPPEATPRRLLNPAATPAATALANEEPSPTPAPTPVSEQSWLLQLISYNNKKSADDFRARLSRDGFVAWREEVTVSGKTYYRVRMKVRGSKSQALSVKQRLESKYRIQASLLGPA